MLSLSFGFEAILRLGPFVLLAQVWTYREFAMGHFFSASSIPYIVTVLEWTQQLAKKLKTRFIPTVDTVRSRLGGKTVF